MATKSRSSGGKKATGTMTMREAAKKGGKKVQAERNLRDTKQVRGKAYDKHGPAKGQAFGIAAITRAFQNLDFPASKKDLLKRAGSQKIEYRKGQPVSLKRIVEDLDTNDFPSMSNVIKAVSGALKVEGLSARKSH